MAVTAMRVYKLSCRLNIPEKQLRLLVRALDPDEPMAACDADRAAMILSGKTLSKAISDSDPELLRELRMASQGGRIAVFIDELGSGKYRTDGWTGRQALKGRLIQNGVSSSNLMGQIRQRGFDPYRLFETDLVVWMSQNGWQYPSKTAGTEVERFLYRVYDNAGPVEKERIAIAAGCSSGDSLAEESNIHLSNARRISNNALTRYEEEMVDTYWSHLLPRRVSAKALRRDEMSSLLSSYYFRTFWNDGKPHSDVQRAILGTADRDCFRRVWEIVNADSVIDPTSDAMRYIHEHIK